MIRSRHDHHQPPLLHLLPAKREFEPNVVAARATAAVALRHREVGGRVHFRAKDMYYVHVLVCRRVLLSSTSQESHHHHREVLAANLYHRR